MPIPRRDLGGIRHTHTRILVRQVAHRKLPIKDETYKDISNKVYKEAFVASMIVFDNWRSGDARVLLLEWRDNVTYGSSGVVCVLRSVEAGRRRRLSRIGR